MVTMSSGVIVNPDDPDREAPEQVEHPIGKLVGASVNRQAAPKFDLGLD